MKSIFSKCYDDWGNLKDNALNIAFNLGKKEGLRIGRKQGKADGYSQAENDYFAQSQKDREDTYHCGYEIGRADAIDDCIQWIVSKFSYIDELDVPRIRCNASTIEINMKEQLMQKGAENESE